MVSAGLERSARPPSPAKEAAHRAAIPSCRGKAGAGVARYLDYFREMAAAATTGLPPPEVIAKVMGRYGLQPVKQ
jgi:hypothetical protein